MSGIALGSGSNVVSDSNEQFRALKGFLKTRDVDGLEPASGLSMRCLSDAAY